MINVVTNDGHDRWAWIDRLAERWWMWVVVPQVIAIGLTCLIWLLWG